MTRKKNYSHNAGRTIASRSPYLKSHHIIFTPSLVVRKSIPKPYCESLFGLILEALLLVQVPITPMMHDPSPYFVPVSAVLAFSLTIKYISQILPTTGSKLVPKLAFLYRIPSIATIMRLSTLLFVLSVSSAQGFSPQQLQQCSHSKMTCRTSTCSYIQRPQRLEMQPMNTLEESSSSSSARGRLAQSKVSAVSIATATMDESLLASDDDKLGLESGFLQTFILPVIYSACMITGNTVGASMLVLPELASGLGMTVTTGVFVTMYLINLVSGLVIADIAIKQKEVSGEEAPSSFKAFAETTFVNNPIAPYLISLICICMNTCVLTFDNLRASQLSHNIFGVDSSIALVIWTTLFASIVSTQTATNISKASSALVLVLFATFGAILLPGLANVSTDPVSLFTSSMPSWDTTIETNLLGQIGYAGPVILTSLVWQNITPTIVRILDYDRTKTMSAIALGTIMPVMMYIAWCVAVLGGGIDMSSVGLDGPLLTIFSFVTVSGSCLGTATSMSEEFDTYLNKSKNEKQDVAATNSEGEVVDGKDSVFSLQAVIATMGASIVLGQFFSEDITSLLKLAGSYGTPLLYGAIPVLMAYTQNQRQQQGHGSVTVSSPLPPSLVPGGYATLACLGTISFGYVGSEILQEVGQVLTPIASAIAI